MNARERFLATMHFEKVDRVPWWEMWYWGDTLDRWYKEGLPRDVHLEDYLGVDRRGNIGVHLGLMPGFDEVTLEETDKYRIFIRGDGVKCQEFREGGKRTMPHWIEFPLKDRATWEDFKRRLNPHSPRRYPLYWEDAKRCLRGRDYPVCISCGGLYGWLRNWIGMENFSVMFYDQPDFVHEMMEYMTDFICTVIRRAVTEVDIDYATFWEDMSYKTGPLISPKMFREFMVPRYQRITSLLRENGVDIAFVDSDGNVDALIPLWIESGINGIFPLEVAGGMDPVALRKKYGRNLLMIGGIDKRAMAAGKKQIEKELLSKLPFLCTQGGYIPWCDHLVPPDVPLENYLYYVKLMKEITTNPKKYL